MDGKNPAAVALGRLGGRSKSARKVAAARTNLRKASRLNGQKGGWPKGKPRKAKPVNLEPMDVKVELRDSDGRKVKTRTTVDRKRGTVVMSVPALSAGTYRQTVSVKGTPRKGKKGKRRLAAGE